MVAWIGVAGFIFYFFYDVNSVLWKNKILHAFFAVGCLCILIATGITVSEVCLTGGYQIFRIGYSWEQRYSFGGIAVYAFFCIAFRGDISGTGCTEESI